MIETGTLGKDRGRFAVRDCIAEFRFTGLLSFLKHKAEERRWPVADLSETGIQLLTREDLEPGDKISIAVDVPAFEGTFTVAGVVKWTRTASEGATVRRVGVEFSKMDNETKSKLQSLRNDEWLRSVNRFKNL